MPEYLSPGVYMEELPGPKPIEGVGTSTGAFVGIAERGPINDPQLITNMTQFADVFGGFLPGAFLAHAVRHFFTEGGTRCYVIRAFKPTPVAPADTERNPDLARAIFGTAAAGAGTVVLTVFASSPGTWGRNMSIKTEAVDFNPDAADPRFKLTVLLNGTAVETFDQLSMNEVSGAFPNPNHVDARINGISKYIRVVDSSTSVTQIAPPFFETQALTNGANGVTMVPNDLIGGAGTAASNATGLFAFDAVDDINIVAIPDLVNPTFGTATVDLTAARNAIVDAVTYCENRKDCFFVADTAQGLSPQQALGYKRAVAPSPVTAGNAFNSKFAALYYPWIYVTDPVTGKPMLMPPSGAVAGSYAESDGRVGVHKAPAGTEDGYLNSAIGVERLVTKGEQDTLNPKGVNVIRKFADAGIVIWGARTVSSDPEWKYVNVRRLFNFLEQSILKGTQGLVFEPNDPSLWKRVTRDVSAFLKVQWMEGKIIGNKPEQAFFVHCNEETNTPETMDLGELITIIGVCPSKPAEFVIFRIKQTRFGGDVSE
jgi:phage tail sheath protein FI